MLSIYSITVDARDPKMLAAFWADVLAWTIEHDGDDEVVIRPAQGGPAILFGRSDDEKTVKNRWHLDLTPDDQQAEVERLLALGARNVDIGQQNTPWVVMADPEGNEFCVLRPRPA